MTVQQLREYIADMPGHWPVNVELPAEGSGGGAAFDYHFTLDVVASSFPTHGCMAVIRLGDGK